MKITVLGDIHGRTIWQDIVKKEGDTDLFIFLGDYVTTHDDITSEQQIAQLEQILNFKEENPDKVILLRGNHDIQMCGYYWARCSGYDHVVAKWFNIEENKKKFESLTQWIYIDDNIKTIFSHAGISKVWVNEILKNIDIHEINSLEPSEKFGFISNDPWDNCGNSIWQSCIWIRPESLINCMYPGYNYVIGHTPFKKIINLKDYVNKEKSNTIIDNDIWCCDTLANNEYLIIIDNDFIPSKL